MVDLSNKNGGSIPPASTTLQFHQVPDSSKALYRQQSVRGFVFLVVPFNSLY